MKDRRALALANLPIPLSAQPDPMEAVTCLSTGVDVLDTVLEGGLPRGKISEIVGTPSSGRTGLILSILAQAIAKEELVAYIDAFDSLDPSFAIKAGIKLKQLLWVRCGASQEKVFKAADILVPTGRFGVLVLDLTPAENPFKRVRVKRVPLSSWFRLQRSLQGTSTLRSPDLWENAVAPVSVIGTAGEGVDELEVGTGVRQFGGVELGQ